MTGKTSRDRGARAERAVVNYLRAHGWPEARRYLSGDGRQPGDIDVWPGVAVEVKDRAESSWPSWCEQAIAEAGPDRIPIVVRRTRGVPDVGAWEARIPLSRWLDLTEAAGRTHVANTRTCARTRIEWVHTTFRAITNLIRAEQDTAA